MVNKSSQTITLRWLTKVYIMAQCSFVVLLGRRSNVLTSAFTSISSSGLARHSIHSIKTFTRSPNQRLSSSLLSAVNDGPDKSNRRPISADAGSNRYASAVSNEDDDEDLFAAMDSLLKLDKSGSSNKASNGVSRKSISPNSVCTQ